MPQIDILGTGILYRNPKPFLRSQHAYFPSVVHLDGEEMLAAFSLGTAFEAVDLHTEVSRSLDGGETWTLEGPLAPGAPHPGISDTYRIALMGDGEVVAFGARYRRDDPEVGFANPKTMGFVPSELALYRSHDSGRTWKGPEIIDPPLKGQPFEICSPIVPLDDGRWLVPTSLWKAWDGDCPHGIKAVALVSHDHGKTWPEYVDVMDSSPEEVIYWEQSLMPLSDGRVMSTAWVHDSAKDEDHDLHYVVSTDGGRSFGPAMPTGLKGQTVRILPVAQDVLLVIYRRMDKIGLWACIVSVRDGGWVTLSEKLLWKGSLARNADRENMVEEFQQLKFGAPSLVRMPDGSVYLAFWCVEDCVSNIRWLRLKVQA